MPFVNTLFENFFHFFIIFFILHKIQPFFCAFLFFIKCVCAYTRIKTFLKGKTHRRAVWLRGCVALRFHF